VHEERELTVDAQAGLLPQLAARGEGRILSRLHVPARQSPSIGIHPGVGLA
jgi:hypothetical protein